ncbi:hypothetical protein AGR1A_Cc30301 [Agrobacterium fabacearum CFBP 5771]|nr:hypothetical protein AGR1A_Cc30301 [Agrobacterium fabacearum CFBP 5771]
MPPLFTQVRRTWSCGSAQTAFARLYVIATATWTDEDLRACVAAANAKPAPPPARQACATPKSCASPPVASSSRASPAEDRSASHSRTNAAVQNSNTLINGTRRQAGFFISVIQEISKLKYTASLTLPVLLISNCLFGILWQMGWDSNPRYALTHAGFQDRFLKPLGHPSIGGEAL